MKEAAVILTDAGASFDDDHIVKVLRFFGISSRVSTTSDFFAGDHTIIDSSSKVRLFCSSDTLCRVIEELACNPGIVRLWGECVHSAFVYAANYPPAFQKLARRMMNDKCTSLIQMDRGHGECWLRRRGVAEIIEKILLEADGRDYRMQAWVVMPNHIHLVVDVWDVPLVKLINGWKGKSSRLANLLLRRSGKFWQEDYYDTLIRDEAHLKRADRYTEQNPVKAFLTKAARDWPWSSARHRDEYERLPWQRGG